MDIKPIPPDPLEPRGKAASARSSADGPSAAAPKDSIEVSDSVEMFTDVAKRLRENLNQVRVERTELLRAVQEMLADGSIDNDDVLTDTANAILRDDN